jgi:CubicO group peptidase (beta-lactamase class C family)
MPAIGVGCTNNSQNSETTEPTTAVTTSATQATTVKPLAATEDTPTQPATYNYVKIKEKSDRLISTFDSFIDSYSYKGTIYYKIGNDFEYIGKNGMSNVEQHKANSINTAYYVGSVTKQFTAAAIMILAEQEKLSVDDTLDKYYSSYTYGKDITIKNLLTMTSGIKSYMCLDGEIDNGVYSYDELGYKVTSDNSAEKNKIAIMDWILSQKLLFDPDTRFCFSDSNYYILGDIIEKVSGESYEDFIKENIFKPLGMNYSSFASSDSLATGYDGTKNCDWIYYDGVSYSSTGIISTVSDLLKWVYALDEYEIISEESLEEMFTPYMENYGYGLFIYGSKAAQMGNSDKFSSMLVYTRDEEEVYISLSNYKYSDPVFMYSLFTNAVSPFYG